MESVPQSKPERLAAFVNWPVVNEGMDALGLDAIVAFSAAATYYFSGCFNEQQLYVRDRPSMVVVPRTGEPTYIVCNSEEPLARSTAWVADVRSYVSHFSPIEALANVLAERGLDHARLGLETEFLPIADAGEPPSLIDPPGGCRIHPRCPVAKAECRVAFPARTSQPSGHWKNCWLYTSKSEV